MLEAILGSPADDVGYNDQVVVVSVENAARKAFEDATAAARRVYDLASVPGRKAYEEAIKAARKVYDDATSTAAFKAAIKAARNAMQPTKE